MSQTPRAFVLVTALSALAIIFSEPALRAATPASGTVTAPSTTITFTGGPFAFTNQTGAPYQPPAPPVSPACVDPASPCDDFALTVSIPPNDNSVYFLQVDLHFANTASDFDLYLIDADGHTVDAISAKGAGVQESFRIQAPSGATTHYTVRVVPYDVTTAAGGDTYSATVSLSPRTAPPDPPEPLDQPTVPDVPRFQTYQSPTGIGNGAGEPSIGADWATGKTMFQAGLQTLRVGWDDCASPADATWENVSFSTTSEASLDAILFTDSRTNRTFSSQLGACPSNRTA